MKALCVHTSSSSQAPSPMAASGTLAKLRFGASTQITHIHRTMNLPGPSMVPLLLLSCKPVTMLWIGPFPSFCRFARRLSASIKLRFEDLALFEFAPICTTTILLGALHSYWRPHAAPHQLQCFFFLLLPSPSPVSSVRLRHTSLSSRCSHGMARHLHPVSVCATLDCDCNPAWFSPHQQQFHNYTPDHDCHGHVSSDSTKVGSAPSGDPQVTSICRRYSHLGGCRPSRK